MTMTPVPSMSESDENLAARFARELTPLRAVLSRGARRLTRCDADGEDLLQDTLLHAYAGFQTFQQGTNLQAWLFRILYNRWVTIYRSRQCRPAEVSVDEITDRDLAAGAARVPGGLASPEAEVLDSLPDAEIRAAMDTLPDGFRIALYYAVVEGYTFAETATKLNIPRGTVMSRVSRGRQRLRVALAHVENKRGNFPAAQQRIA